jgi:hypothetical protein
MSNSDNPSSKYISTLLDLDRSMHGFGTLGFVFEQFVCTPATITILHGIGSADKFVGAVDFDPDFENS